MVKSLGFEACFHNEKTKKGCDRGRIIENQLQNKFPRLRPEEVEDDAGVSGSRLVRLRLLQEPGDPLREGANLQDAASLDPLLRLELVVDGQVAVGALRLEVLGQVADVKLLVLETKKGL